MVENGIKPAYVFDGKPPELKSGVVCVLTIHNSSRGSLVDYSTLVVKTSRTERGSERGGGRGERNR